MLSDKVHEHDDLPMYEHHDLSGYWHHDLPVYGLDDLVPGKLLMAAFEKAVERQCVVLPGHADTLRSALAVLRAHVPQP